jgi:hypothetical protein
MTEHRHPADIVDLLRALQAEETELVMQLVAERLAHDTGSILHALAGTATLLEERPAGDPRPLIQTLRLECQRLEGTIVRLLAFLRGPDSGPACFHPAEVVETLWRASRHYFRSQGLALSLGRLGRRSPLPGRRHLFMELVWKFLLECLDWRAATPGQPASEVRLGWSDAAVGGTLRFHLRGVAPPAQFRTLAAKAPRGRDIVLQTFPTAWLIVAALTDRFDGRMRVRQRPPDGWAVELALKGDARAL